MARPALRWMLTLFLVVGFGGAASSQFVPSLGSRPRPGAETWFEGWYTRITADNGQDVIGVVVGSLVRRDGQPASGYVAILRRNVVSRALEVYEHFPSGVRVRSAGRPVRLGPSDDGGTAFRWEADGIGHLTEREIDLHLPCGPALQARFHDRRPWNPGQPWRGPEGLAEQVPLLRCHWSVYSVASQASFTLTMPSGELVGRGVAHQETNWGEAFPKAYVWAQASSPDGQTTFALAGGVLPVGSGFVEGWLLGLRTPSLQWDFRPQVPGTSFTTRIDARCGRISMTARSLLRTVELEVSAPPSTFSRLAIPTRNGWARETIQSFSGQATIHAYRHGPGGRNRTLVEQIQIANAALEFGGQCCP